MENQWDILTGFLESRIKQLYHINNESGTRVAFAKMRRGLGKSPSANPEIWDITFTGMPEVLMGKGPEPSYGEWAVHLVLTLFSVHQQGKNIQTEQVFEKGAYLGKAMRKLIRSEEDETRIKRRFDQLITSDSLGELSNHLRSVIQLFKAEGIGLDYVALGRDLYSYQIPNLRDGVRLKWGRDFYKVNGTGVSESNIKKIEEK